MSHVVTTSAFPDEWTRLGPLSRILSVRTDEQQSIRIHYGDENTPANDAAYAVIQNHLPRSVVDDAVVWIMSDNTDIIEINYAIEIDTSGALYPASGALPFFVVGEYGWQKIKAPDLIDGDWTFNIADAELPPGLSITHDHIGGQRIGAILGTPTEPGTFFVTVSANHGNRGLAAYYTIEVREPE